VSDGCDNCYADAWDSKWGGDHWGKGQPRRTFSEKHWAQLTRWNKIAETEGAPARVFCASMADIMDDEAPEGELARLFEAVDKTPHLIYQFLTKRPHRYASRLPVEFPLRNVWLGTTAENQHFYDVRWDVLCRLRNEPAYHGLPLWVSYEPALGPLSIRGFADKPDWIICGGESGEVTRPMEQRWAEDLLQECREFGVAFFMKQMAARTPKAGMRLIPPHLLVRQYPATPVTRG
jgi:protein gp37